MVPAKESERHKTRWGHVIIVVPDGRILLHRNLYSGGKVESPWCATLNTVVTAEEDLLDAIKLKMRTLFELDSRGRVLEHVLDHTILARSVGLKVYRIKLDSTTKLYCSAKIEVACLSFKDLIGKIRKHSEDFTETTRTTYNIISRTQAIGED